MLLLAALACVSSPAAELWLPPIDGQFSGKLSVTKLAGAPAVNWTIRVRSTRPDERVADLSLDGEGTRVRAQVGIDRNRSGWWKITEGELDAAAWFPAASAEIGSAADGVAAEGKIELKGGGALHEGQPSGNLEIAWQDGRLHNESAGWTLDGIAVSGEFAIEAAGYQAKSVSPLTIGVKTISTARFGARNLFLALRLNDERTATLTEGRIEIAGGNVTAEPVTWPLVPPRFDVSLRIENVGLQDVAALVPAGLSESRGRINGVVRLGWSEATGFQLGQGNLVLGSTEPAIVRLAPAEGFLTERVPTHFELLPNWLGPLARWFRPENPAYAELHELELGLSELRVETLSVQITPDGDRDGRTARVRLTARSTRAGSVIDVVTFDVNVAGPLAQVLRLGINQSFSVELR